jgi:integrase
MGEAGDLFIETDLKRRADLRITSRNALKQTTVAFCDQFRDLNVRQIGREEISKFLFGHDWATVTIINTRGRLNRLFDWLLVEGYCASNPVKLVRHERLRTDIGRVEAKIPRVLPLEDVVALFTTAKKVMPDFIPYLVLGVFAGVRPREIVSSNDKPGIEWNMVNMDKSLILIPPRSAKCKVPRKITIHNNMAKWLQLGGKLPLTLKEAEMRRKALRMATFGEEWRTRWDSDIMRHTYASYHLEHFKSPDRLKMEMGHQISSQVLEEHYLNTMIDSKDAEAFWNLVPQSC